MRLLVWASVGLAMITVVGGTGCLQDVTHERDGRLTGGHAQHRELAGYIARTYYAMEEELESSGCDEVIFVASLAPIKLRNTLDELILNSSHPIPPSSPARSISGRWIVTVFPEILEVPIEFVTVWEMRSCQGQRHIRRHDLGWDPAFQAWRPVLVWDETQEDGLANR